MSDDIVTIVQCLAMSGSCLVCNVLIHVSNTLKEVVYVQHPLVFSMHACESNECMENAMSRQHIVLNQHNVRISYEQVATSIE